MAESRIFVVCRDPKQFAWVRRELAGSGFGRLCAVATSDDLQEVVRLGNPSAILYWEDADSEVEDLSRVLWVSTLGRRAIPVVVVTRQYEESRAALSLMMGASDVLSTRKHRGKLATVLQWISREATGTTAAVKERRPRVLRPTSTRPWDLFTQRAPISV